MIGNEGNRYDFTFDYGDIRFIGLNTGKWWPATNPTSTVLSGLSDGQMDWLDLKTIGADHIFVFGHGDIVGHDGDYNPDYNRENFVEWANSNPVEAYFCGHTHENNGFGADPSDPDTPEKITSSNMNDPPSVSTSVIPFDWYAVYLETVNST